MNGVFVPMRELAERVRRHPVRRDWIPLEYRTSWWVPILSPENGRLYLTAFFYPVVAGPGEPSRVGRPQLQCTLDPTVGQFVEVVDCSLRDFAAHLPPDPVVGTLTPELAPAQTAEGWDRLRSELYEAYDPLLPVAFRDPADLSKAQQEAVVRFRQVFERVVEPFLRPYYEALNPAFFEWLRRVA
ncbi:MAG: hypothetical protein ACO1SX_00740 [Actinomycetota bacterium]